MVGFENLDTFKHFVEKLKEILATISYVDELNSNNLKTSNYNILNTSDKTIVGAINELKELLNSVDATTLNGYSLWVGTSEELNNIENRDPNTLYFEMLDNVNNEVSVSQIDVINDTSEDVVQVNVVDGVLTLTTDKYQKTTIVGETEIVFPTVNKFTEIHLYFNATSNVNLIFPDCRWQTEPNIEEGKSYEIVCTYNTIEWLVNVIVYS